MHVKEEGKWERKEGKNFKVNFFQNRESGGEIGMKKRNDGINLLSHCNLQRAWGGDRDEGVHRRRRHPAKANHLQVFKMKTKRQKTNEGLEKSGMQIVNACWWCMRWSLSVMRQRGRESFSAPHQLHWLFPSRKKEKERNDEKGRQNMLTHPEDHW